MTVFVITGIWDIGYIPKYHLISWNDVNNGNHGNFISGTMAMLVNHPWIAGSFPLFMGQNPLISWISQNYLSNITIPTKTSSLDFVHQVYQSKSTILHGFPCGKKHGRFPLLKLHWLPWCCWWAKSCIIWLTTKMIQNVGGFALYPGRFGAPLL